MIRVTSTKEKYSFIWILSVVITATLHLGFFLAGNQYTNSRPRKVYESSRLDFRTVKPVEPPKPIADKEPEVENPKRQLPDETKNKIAKTIIKRKPKSNTSKPKRDPIPAEQASDPAKPVFGATANSVVDNSGGVAIRVGNTLEKEMEPTYTPPKKVAALPPTDREQAPPQATKKKVPLKPVPVYELSRAPSFKNKIEPKYPEQARKAGIEGVVQLETLIDEDGRVRKIKVLKSPGHGLEKAAILALSKSRFHPGVVNGKPVPVKIKIPYRFVLDA